MITVYGRRTSSNVQIVMWTMAELGIEHERFDYGHRFGGLDTPEFGALNPNRLVPVIRDGDLVIWESGAILRYLAAKYAPEGFWPRDPAERAPVDMWAEWGKVTMTAAFTGPIFWGTVRTPSSQQDEAALKKAFERFDRLLDMLERQLGDRSFVVGDRLTTADIVIGHLLYRYHEIEIPRQERPVLSRYYAALCERPAYRQHVMVSFDELRATGV